MIKLITADSAIVSALKYLGLENEAYRCLEINLDDNLYGMAIQTICMEYFIYVDASNGDVLGINSEPYMDLDTVYTDSSIFAA